MNTSWHYVEEDDLPSYIKSAEKYERIKTPPVASPPFTETHASIYPTTGKSVIRRGGEEFVVESSERVKLLPSSQEDDPWVYEVKQMEVRVPGGWKASLKEGTKVAVLPRNYKKLLEK